MSLKQHDVQGYLRSMLLEKTNHWENVFTTKTDQQKSWFEKFPNTSMQIFQDLNIAKDASIIDVGAGDSRLPDALLKQHFTDITVLDISQTALDRSRKRLGEHSGKIKWVATDILNYNAIQQYDCVHDRAVFHFMTKDPDRDQYLKRIHEMLKTGGKFILATFSGNGYDQCSGLTVNRYNQENIESLLSPWFQKIKCFETEHRTPQGKTQHFMYCSFFKK